MFKWASDGLDHASSDSESSEGLDGREGQDGRDYRPSCLMSLHLIERFLNQTLVVFTRDVALKNLRGNLDGQVDGLAANLLEGPRRFQLNLLLGIPDDAFGFRSGLLPHFLAESFGVGSTGGDDRLRFRPRLSHDLRGLLLEPLEFLFRPLGIVERRPNGLLTGIERLEQRTPGKLRQHGQQDQERDDGPDEQSWIWSKKRIIHTPSREWDGLKAVPYKP